MFFSLSSFFLPDSLSFRFNEFFREEGKQEKYG